MSSPVVRQRELLAVPLLTIVFVGVPALLTWLGYEVERVNAEEHDRDVMWRQAAPGLVTLVVGLLTWFGSRRKPASWARRAAYSVGTLGWFASAVVSINAIGTDVFGESTDIVRTICFVPVVAPVAWALGLLATRVMTRPLRPELGDSRYEWPVPVRGVRNTQLLVGVDRVEIAQTYTVRTGSNTSSTRTRGQKLPLEALRTIQPTHGATIDLPPEIELSAPVASGPSVTIETADRSFTIPVDEATVVAHLIQQRRSSVRQGVV